MFTTKMLHNFWLMACISALVLAGCSNKLTMHKISKLISGSAIVNDHFTGFALYDMDEHRMICQLNSDKYFIPASNTKLFTFYTCLKMLGDSIPSIRYVIRGDSLIFWGTGDPSFLHSDLKGTKALYFLKESGKNLFFSDGQYANDFYGNGWPWNDYADYYQAEINELPVEDNVAVFYRGADGSINVKPARLKQFLQCDSSFKPSTFQIKRDFLSNRFTYPAMPVPAAFKQEIPWKTSTQLTLALLADTLKRQVTEVNVPLPDDVRFIYDLPADTVYRHMLQPSDNFMAEQLLLVCSAVHFKIMNSDSVRAYAIDHFMADLPDKPHWVDGSGLSRQNLFTPGSIIALLVKINDEIKDEQLLHSLLPIGGVTGTIKNAYKTDNGKPFVWAKTGSLNNNYNQSGYLVTRKGKRLAFSFMNNNFTRPTSQIRDELVRIMTYIHNTY